MSVWAGFGAALIQLFRNSRRSHCSRPKQVLALQCDLCTLAGRCSPSQLLLVQGPWGQNNSASKQFQVKQGRFGTFMEFLCSCLSMPINAG